MYRKNLPAYYVDISALLHLIYYLEFAIILYISEIIFIWLSILFWLEISRGSQSYDKNNLACRRLIVFPNFRPITEETSQRPLLTGAKQKKSEAFNALVGYVNALRISLSACSLGLDGRIVNLVVPLVIMTYKQIRAISYHIITMPN